MLEGRIFCLFCDLNTWPDFLFILWPVKQEIEISSLIEISVENL